MHDHKKWNCLFNVLAVFHTIAHCGIGLVCCCQFKYNRQMFPSFKSKSGTKGNPGPWVKRPVDKPCLIMTFIYRPDGSKAGFREKPFFRPLIAVPDKPGNRYNVYMGADVVFGNR